MLDEISPSAGMKFMDWSKLLSVMRSGKKGYGPASAAELEVKEQFECWVRRRNKPQIYSSGRGHHQSEVTVEKVLSDLHKLKFLRRVAFHSAKPAVSALKSALHAAKDILQLTPGDDGEYELLQELEVNLKAISKDRGGIEAEGDIMTIDIRLHNVSCSEKQMFIQQPRAKPCFIGRAEELHRLKEYLAPGNLVILSGKAGSGKTAMAIELANLCRDHFPVQIWLPASSTTLLKNCLARSFCMLSCSGSNKSPLQPYEKDNQHEAILYVIDGLQSPEQVIPCLPASVHEHSAVLCTTWHYDPNCWDRVRQPSYIEHLQPLEMHHILAFLESHAKTYVMGSQALAEFVVSEGILDMLEKQLNHPLDLRSFVSRVKQSSVPQLLENLRTENAGSMQLQKGVDTHSGDVSLLHNDGYEVLLRRSLPWLAWEEKLLLLALSFLCRRLSSLPLSVFSPGAAQSIRRLKLSQWNRFLGDSEDEWQTRRENAIVKLSRHGLVQWCPVSRSVTIDLLLQRHVAKVLPGVAIEPTGEMISLGDISDALCTILLYCFEAIYAEGCQQDESGKNVCPNMVIVIELAESLLDLSVMPSGILELRLRVWLARSIFSIHLDFDRAAKHYAKCLMKTDVLNDEDRGWLPLLAMECGMTLWRCGKPGEALEVLKQATDLLQTQLLPVVNDPCLPFKHDCKELTLQLSWEMAVAQNNCAASKCNPLFNLTRHWLLGGLHVIQIGPLFLSTIGAEMLDTLEENFQLAILGKFVEACDNVIAKAIEIIEVSPNSVTLFFIAPLAQVLSVLFLCCELEAFEFFSELFVDINSEIWRTFVKQQQQYLCLHKVRLCNTD